MLRVLPDAAHNLAVLRQFVLNLLRLSPVKRKGGLKEPRRIAATADSFRAELLGLVEDSCDCAPTKARARGGTGFVA